MMRARIGGIGLWGPGLPGFDAGRPVLLGARPWRDEPMPPPPALLAATERRRAGLVVRLALTAATEAVTMAGLPPAALRAVFASSDGDGAVIHGMLTALATPEADVSPTQFHNSVHNAAAGYWAIGAGSAQPACCLGGHDASFAAGLLKAMAEVQAEGVPVLLCAYDAPLPAPLGAKRRTTWEIGIALVLLPEDGAAGPRLEAAYHATPQPDTLPRLSALQDLARRNPAGRALRLLESLALGERDRCALAMDDGHLALRLEVAG
jgi:hypothetical protein